MIKKYVPIEELLPESQKSVFKLVMLVAKRGVQLSEGARLLVPRVTEKPLDNAVYEILNKKVHIK